MLLAGLGQRAGKALFEALEALERTRVGDRRGVAGSLLSRKVGGDDEVDLLLDVVECEHLVEEHEAGVGDAEFVDGERGQAFDLADDIVGKEADRAGRKGRQARQARGGVAAERLLEFREDVALEGPSLAGFFDGDVRPAGDDLLVRLDADERVTADMLAALDGFQQEGLGLLGGDAQEGGDRRLQVRSDGAVDGDERVLAGETGEFAGGGRGWGRGGHGGWFHPTRYWVRGSWFVERNAMLVGRHGGAHPMAV